MNYPLCDKKGINIPVLLAVVICLVCYVTSFAWSMARARSSFQKTLNNRKAYYMARSGAEHLILKLKIMKQSCPESINSLVSGTEEERAVLNKAFMEDILVPFGQGNDRCLYEYRATDFSFNSDSRDKNGLIFQLTTEGKYSGYKSSVTRLVQLSR